MGRVLFATSFGHDAIVKTILENRPISKLVVFEDKNQNDVQESSLKFIESITKVEKIRTSRVKLPLYDCKKIVSTLDRELKKYRDYELIFDISHGPRSQALTIILYLMIKYPSNVRKISYFNPTHNELVEYPLFRIESLSDKEFECLVYIKDNKRFFQKDLAEHLEISAAHTSRILDKLQEENFIYKEKGCWYLTDKAQIYLLAKGEEV